MFNLLRRRLHVDDLLSIRLLTFLIVGGLASIISLIATESLFLVWHWSLWVATIPASELAILFKWSLNSRLTWEVHTRPYWRFFLHELSCLAGVVIQLGAVFFISTYTTTPSLITISLGILAGTGVNFIINEHFVFEKTIPAFLPVDQRL